MSNSVVVWLSIPSKSLGFDPSPTDVHVRFFPISDRWLGQVWAPEGSDDAALQWLASNLTIEEVDQIPDARVVSVAVPRLPSPLQRLEENLEVGVKVFQPDGDVRVRLHGTRAEICDHLERREIHCSLDRVVPADRAPSKDDPLTAKERDVLLDAYRAGYFDVPRQIRLGDLADRLGRSKGGLSALLRRGVKCVLEDYVHRSLGRALGVEDEPPDRGSPAQEAPQTHGAQEARDRA